MMRAGFLPICLVCAAIAFLLACAITVRAGWDVSAPLLVGIAAGVAAFAAVLLVLPGGARRFVVSMLIVFHFGGIFTAIASGEQQPWVAGVLWTYVYRNYLQFMHLTDSYRYYAPEPGPSNLLWFLIDYEPGPDGTRHHRWIKVPDFDENGRPVDENPDGTRRRIPRVQLTRRLTMAKNCGWPAKPPGDLNDRHIRHVSAGISPDLALLRQACGDSVWPHAGKIPAEMPIEIQYREPVLYGKIWLPSYARYVARTFPHLRDPARKVVSVRVYLVVHNIVYPHEHAVGMPMDHPSLYYVYFQGEYDSDGNLRSRTFEFNENGELTETHRDPFLYWLIHPAPK